MGNFIIIKSFIDSTIAFNIAITKYIASWVRTIKSITVIIDTFLEDK